MHFANQYKIPLTNLASNKSDSSPFSKTSRESVNAWLQNPGTATNVKNLRDLSKYLYTISPHYKRLCDYFASLYCLYYVMIPDRIDLNGITDKLAYDKQYQKAADLLDLMNVRSTFLKIAQVCAREDVCYGYIYRSKDSFIIYQMPSDYCTISSITDGCFSYAFDFSYFRQNQDKLEMFGQEFITKYNLYLQDTNTNRWQELDNKNQICLKWNETIPYPVIPFSGVFESVYNIQDYKELMKTKDATEIYKAIALKIPLNKDGEFTLPKELYEGYYKRLVQILPEEVGAFQTPADIVPVSFEQSGVTDINKVKMAEDQLWSAEGVSSSLFMSNIESAHALTISIQADEQSTSQFVKQIERNINKILKQEPGKYKFKVLILDVTQFNKQEMFDMYLKGGNASLPHKSMACAVTGMTPNDIRNMEWIEKNIIGFDSFTPLNSSHTQSEGGRPTSRQIGEAGEKTRDNDSNAER